MPSVDDLASIQPTSEHLASLTWVYPVEGHTTWERATFVMGSFTFPPNARSAVLILTQTPPSMPTLAPIELPLTLSPTARMGFFSHRIALHPGCHDVTLSLSIDDQIVHQHTRPIERQMPPDVMALWSQPITDPYAWAWPTQPIAILDAPLLQEQGLHLGFWGPAGINDACVKLQLNAKRITVPLMPMGLADDTPQSQFAQRHQLQAPLPLNGVWYGATLSTQDWPVYATATPMTITYQATYKAHVQTFKPMAGLTLPATTSPMTWFILNEPTTAKRGGATGVPLSPQWLPNTRVQGITTCDDWVAVSALPSSLQPRWQQASDWVWLPESALTPSSLTGWALDNQMTPRCPHITQVRATGESAQEGWVRVGIPLPFPVPVCWQADETVLTVTMSGVTALNEWVVLPDAVRRLGVEALTWLPEALPDRATLQIRLSKPLWGVKVGYDGDRGELMVHCRTTMGLRKALDTRPLRLLIDPGHGGDETGAVALDGTPEKLLNLAIAQSCVALNAQLTEKIEVLLTRCDDTTVSLADRVAFCEQQEPDVIVSLHHNALPDGRDPEAEHGLSTFYWHGFAQPLAQRLQTLATAHQRTLGLADYGVIQTDFTMTRLSMAPAVLLECGFLTHPGDTITCLDITHADMVAQWLMTALGQTVRDLKPANRAY